jgi:hypothetical protein
MRVGGGGFRDGMHYTKKKNQISEISAVQDKSGAGDL